MRLAALVAGMLMLMISGVALLARSGQADAQLGHQANSRAMSTAIVTAAAALNTDVVNSVTSLNVGSAGSSFSGSVPCGSRTCSWQAARATESVGGASSTVVVGGGGTRTLDNQNLAVDSSGNPVGNELLYRITLTTPDNMVLPLDETIQLLDSDPIESQVLNLRLDRAALTGGSIAYADQLCGDPTLNCANLTSGADTTVITAQNGCFEQTQGATDVQSACNPVGDSAATPQPVNNFNTRTDNDGSIAP